MQNILFAITLNPIKFTILIIKFNPQDIQERQEESIQNFGNNLSEIQDNLSKMNTSVKGNADKDSKLSQQIEVIQKRLGKSSERITSNTNAVEAVKVGW